MPEKLPDHYDRWKTDPRDDHMEHDDDGEVVPINRVFGPMIRQLERDKVRTSLIKIFGKADNIVGDNNG